MGHQQLTPVVLLVYYYPPCNLTAAIRVESWAKQLHEFGFYPVVITRNWDIPIEKQTDCGRSSGDRVRVEEFGRYEVHYVPYIGSWRDKHYFESGGSNLLTQCATTIELLGQHVTRRSLPYDNLYDYTRELIMSHADYRLLVVSVNPWPLLRFAWELKGEFPGIRWIADYRDDWSTTELGRPYGLLDRLLHFLDIRSEKKWVKSASKVVSVSDELTERICSFTVVEGTTIANGFCSDLIESIGPVSSHGERFTLTYTGYLFKEQNVELLLDAFKRACDEYGECIQLKLQFIGLSYYPPAAQRVLASMAGYESFLDIKGRVPQEECLRLEMASDCLVMISYGALKGIPASKLYQYIGCRRPILLCPSDRDIIESILDDTGLGLVANSSDEAYDHLSRMIQMKRSGETPMMGNEASIPAYSRRGQTKKLALLLDEVVSKG